MTIINKKIRKTEQKQVTVREFATPAQAKAEFLKIVENNGNQDTIAKLCHALDFLLAAGRPFDEQTVLTAMKAFDVEDSISEIQRLLKTWLGVMQHLNKITVIAGAYDTEIILPI